MCLAKIYHPPAPPPTPRPSFCSFSADLEGACCVPLHDRAIYSMRVLRTKKPAGTSHALASRLDREQDQENSRGKHPPKTRAGSVFEQLKVLRLKVLYVGEEADHT